MTRRTAWLLRHGQTEWNVLGRIQGHSDVGLNAVGVAQAQDAVDRLAHLPIGRVVSSDLCRAVDTARPAAARLGLPISTDPRLRERMFGSFEALTWGEIETRFPDACQAYKADRRSPIPGAEPLDALEQRVLAAVCDAAFQAPQDRDALVVTHGGALRVLLSLLPDGGPQGPVTNCALYRVEVEPGRLVSGVQCV